MFAKLIEEKTLHEGSVLAYISNGKILKTGIATTKGIKCFCTFCNGDNIFGVSTFEDHAGSGHRRPTKHIFLHDNQYGGYGMSLEMLKYEPGSRDLGQVQSVAHRGESSTASGHGSRDLTVEDNYIICGLCSLRKRRGELLFCSKESIADGRWCCPNRICRGCRSPLCERTTFSLMFQGTLQNGENWNPLLNCDQCGDTYHNDCLRKRRSEVPSFQSFCSANCEKISMIIGDRIQNLVPHQEDSPPLTVVKWNEELFWSLLDNTEASIDTLHSVGKLRALSAQKLFHAMNILSKIILDANTSERKIMFKKMLYNHRSTQSDLDHNGFLVVLIEEDKEVSINKNKPKIMMQEVLGAATIRIHSQKVVEMPFIATSESSHGLLIHSRLIDGLHEMLKQLGVTKWVVQSPPEFEDKWENLLFHRVSRVVMRPLLKENNLLQLENTAFMCKDIKGSV